jgi:hypothetical protein
MSAIKYSKSKKSSSYTNHFIVAGILAGVGIALLAYLMFYVAPAEVLETVKVVAVTDSGCIAETLDGHAVNIGNCNAEPGDYISALVDQKVKERAALMNPTN